MYLLLKSEHSSQEDVDASLIQSHPVMARLQKWNTMAQKFDDRVESKVDGLEEQLDNLVKAAALMKSGVVEDNSDSQEDSDDDDEHANEADASVNSAADIEQIMSDASSDDDDGGEKAAAANDEAEQLRRNVLNEARFGLRRREIEEPVKAGKRRRRAIASDLGDDGPDDIPANASKSLASTLNAIEQRSATSKKRAVANVEGLDEPEEDDAELRRGLEMMEADLGKESDVEDSGKADEDGLDAGDELADEYDDRDFYEQAKKKSKSRKEFKKSMYAVAPKFPRVEHEVAGERAISRTILKNRGLVAHKAKINRNPRVKKREQYRKALIRRKGAVREIRTDEGHKYGGEETGIKTGLSRSQKFGGK